MSLYKLILHRQAIREPHWHANAEELGYCLKGKVLVSIYGNYNSKETFMISKGEVFFIPSGALHDIENIGEESAELILQFSHEDPEDFGLSTVFRMFSSSVLGNTWGVSKSHFQPIKPLAQETFISKRKTAPHLPKEVHYHSKYQYNLEGSAPVIGNEGGSARVARQNVWPILQRQALYSLHLTGQGMREPHWHPETAELGYVASGKGRMSILSPSGEIDTFELEEGNIYFIPPAYPHHIENIQSSGLHVLIFFNRPMPQDVGFTGSVKSYSDEVLAATLAAPEELFAKLPIYYEDLFIVKKINPID